MEPLPRHFLGTSSTLPRHLLTGGGGGARRSSQRDGMGCGGRARVEDEGRLHRHPLRELVVVLDRHQRPGAGRRRRWQREWAGCPRGQATSATRPRRGQPSAPPLWRRGRLLSRCSPATVGAGCVWWAGAEGSGGASLFVAVDAKVVHARVANHLRHRLEHPEPARARCGGSVARAQRRSRSRGAAAAASLVTHILSPLLCLTHLRLPCPPRITGTMATRFANRCPCGSGGSGCARRAVAPRTRTPAG